ncbi:MAG: 16S rRNA (cytosine(1402)-N(4))-methyltransferase RsmH [Candidatus Moranbacteria bacterium]|nr:16S rRNA (cytosine(1402)-N(4))-methyltransferase RsmH [Candidatus Moranbacteria bacterium]
MKETREISKHVPVLMEEVLVGLNLDQGKSIVDATLGGGGHTRAIWKQIAPTGKLLSLDQDASAIEHFLLEVRRNTDLQGAYESEQLKVAHANFSELERIIAEEVNDSVDGIMADLGYSSDQIESNQRGLSFTHGGPLDMRLDQSRGVPVSTLLHQVSKEELAKILREYGEVDYAEQIAKAILDEDRKKPIETAEKLAAVVVGATPGWIQAKQKIHPATQVFQALRIWVNDEYQSLEKFLEATEKVLKKGGRVAIIAFHSGEDRIVKEFFRAKIKGCVCPKEFPICICGVKPTFKAITKKVVTASESELEVNPRSRSAKLRVYEKV